MVHKLDRQFFVEDVSERPRAAGVLENNNTPPNSVSECGTVKKTVTTEKISRKGGKLRKSCDHQDYKNNGRRGRGGGGWTGKEPKGRAHGSPGGGGGGGKRRRSSSTDVDDFEKFCTNFNRSSSGVAEEAPPPTATDCDRADHRGGGEIFKRPQRVKRRVTGSSSSSSSDETNAIAGLIQNFNSVARLDDPSERNDWGDLSPPQLRGVTAPPPAGRHVTNLNKKFTINCEKKGNFLVDTRSTGSSSSSPPSPGGATAATSILSPLKYSTDSPATTTIILGAKKFGDPKQQLTPQKTGASHNAGSNFTNSGGSAASGNQRGAPPPLTSGGGSGGSSHNFCHTTSTFSLDKNEEFQFLKPPECPVFKPNDEEFKNPLAYISKIRPFAEKYGICKIKPPKTWTPPFTVDVDKLRFTPRVQRLNELEAKTRVKLNFLDQIAKFWELQGSSLKIPMVERKALDLYTLHRIVQHEGGMEVATKDRKWSKIAQRMGYPAGKSIGTILKGHYERILNPFDIFTSGKSVDLKLETESDDQDYKPHGIISRQQITPPNETTARRSKRFANSNASCGLGSAPIKDESEIKREEEDDDDEDEEEEEALVEKRGPPDYRRIPCYGGGRSKIGGRNTTRSRMMAAPLAGPAIAPSPSKKKPKEVDPLAKYICHICNRGDAEEAMLLCDGCDDSYHTFCLIPPLSDIPKGDWRCPKCVVEEVSKPQEAFGFEQASREYTLQQFGEMADQFKADYFNMSVHLVPTELVEREFWRIVSSIDEDVTVEYGADLHTMDHGSGFPTKSSLYLLPGDQEYAESSWNLNNLPLLEESILGHINADISGMKVPWMYVGMCFATFCWHNEDHWSYSINYLHWGEAKTWYGVPGSRAEAFETTMRSAAPELFHSQPDLLHQLVTIMNPNILMSSGVPVYRTDQHAGEFVITFPRAYHAGFNQGYNFAEAVNFAPADWMKMGRECINHYSTLRRFCVFSHDELVCKMALDPDRLNLGIATACYLDMAEMVDSEKKLRKSLLEWGVTQAEREPFELIPDDERQCDSCKTTCFLSAVSCSCTQAIVCLRHYTELCECPPDKHTLKYRYTLDELPLMLKKLKIKAESFETWLSKVRDVLDPNTRTAITLEELQELSQEAEEKKFPSSVLLERLNSAVLEAEKCVTVIQQLDINKMRTRTRNSNESAKYKLSLDELELFVQEIDNLCCVIQEGQSVRELRSLGKEFAESAKIQLAKPINKSDEKALERLIEEGGSLCIELHEIKALKDRLQQVNWFNRIRDFCQSNEKKSVAEIKALIKEGLSVTPDAVIEKQLINLQDIILAVEEWELVAEKCFKSGTQHELPEIELLIERAEEIQGILPSYQPLKDALKKAKEWLGIVENLQANETYPYFHTLENVVNRGKNIPFKLEELQRMEDHLNAAKLWKERTSKTFLKKDTTFTLMDVLSPRSDAVMVGSKGKKKPLEDQFTEETGPAQMVNAFKNAEEKELREMRDLRLANGSKNPHEDKYCLCKRKFQGHMYHCQLCRDWFHDTCVPPPKTTVRPRSSNVATPTGTPFVPQLNVREKDRESKYLCQSCMRSRRPRLETILSLLVSLQRLPIRLPEGEALQCLTERAMNWQDRARQAFATEDVASALAALSIISQKITETGRNEKILTDIIRKGKPNRKRRSLPQMSDDDGPPTSSDDEEFARPLHIHEDVVASGGESSPSSPTKIEHAYSVPPPSASAISSYGKVSSPVHKSDLPLIQLSKTTRETLEDLMMEGDLLEVSLDETLHIWRILNAAKPSMSDLAYMQYRYNIVTSSNDVLVSNSKKRRSDETAGPQTKRSSKVSTTTALSGSEKCPAKIKRGRKLKLIATKDSDNAPILVGETKKQRKRGKKIQQQQEQVTTASTSDDDEECSAVSCARPSGREVDWVQCDGGCNKWFHMFCVGLDKNSIKPDDDYICKLCKKTHTKVVVSEGVATQAATPTTTLAATSRSPPRAGLGGASSTHSPPIVTSTSTSGSNPPSPGGGGGGGEAAAGQQHKSSPPEGAGPTSGPEILAKTDKVQPGGNVLTVISSITSPLISGTPPNCSSTSNCSSISIKKCGGTNVGGNISSQGGEETIGSGRRSASPPPSPPPPQPPAASTASTKS